MATKSHFNFYNAANEQNLLDDLVVESIKIYGIDMVYIARSAGAYDDVLNEDGAPVYEKTYEAEFYVKSVDGFQGDGVFLSKFGLEIRDQVTLVVARKTFESEVTRNNEAITRPREGDLIYFPLSNYVFKIMFVDAWKLFYQLGSLTSWEIRCELFDYSNEVFNTGYPAIDALGTRSVDLSDFGVLTETGMALTDESGNPIITDEYDLSEIDPISDNDDFELADDDYLDWTQTDPFSEGRIGDE